MRFRVDQTIRAPRAVVEEAFLDPEWYAALEAMPNIDRPHLLGTQEEDADTVHVRVQYAFNGHLPPAARRVLDPGKLTWVNEATVHRGDHRTDFRMVPDHYPDRLRFWGSYRFEEDDGMTHQIIEGDLIVRYPIVGPLVERAILTGMRQHLAEEAKLLESWAQDRS